MADKIDLAAIDPDVSAGVAGLLSKAFKDGMLGRDAGSIWADPNRTDESYTADGSFDNPYKTLETACVALTAARPNIMLMPGVYDVEAEILLPTTFGITISGIGHRSQTEIQAPPAVAAGIFQIIPVGLTGTAVYTLSNLYIEHGDQIGIQIDNAAASRKIILILKNVEMGGDEEAIDVDHDLGSEGVCLYIDDSYIEGKINFDVGNDDDRLYFTNCQLDGVLDTTGDNTTVKIRAQNCMIPAGAWATNGTSTAQVLIMLGCFAYTDKVTIAAAATGDVGSGALFTETIV